MGFSSMASPSDQTLEARRWLAFAEEDLAYGRLGMAGFRRAASWSLQQAAEKALKSMLILKGQPPRRTHDLMTLFNSVVVLADDWEKLRTDVLSLAEIAASSRYPDDLPPIDQSDIERFARSAKNIVAQAQQTLRDCDSQG